MLTYNTKIKSTSVFKRTNPNSPAVVYDNSHSCGRRQSGQVEVDMFHPWWDFAHTKKFI